MYHSTFKPLEHNGEIWQLNAIRNLCYSVGIIAVQDYKRALRYLFLTKSIDNNFNLIIDLSKASDKTKLMWRLKQECEKFFTSDYFRAICRKSSEVVSALRKEMILECQTKVRKKIPMH